MRPLRDRLVMPAGYTFNTDGTSITARGGTAPEVPGPERHATGLPDRPRTQARRMTESPHRSPFLHEAEARGYIFQCTDMLALDAALATGIVGGYVGFDATADSLHVGHMIPIMVLRLLQRHGHRPVPLLGGGTTRIGDPSFRDEARQLLDAAGIDRNRAGIRANLAAMLRFGDGPSDAIMPDNAEWLDRLGYIDLLREVGVHFSVSRMLGFDSVRQRLEREQGLTFLEFNYSILQSYDFRELWRRHGVTLQMGGSDQWGNIVSGVDLVRRTDQKQVFGLTTPLLTTASGAKHGQDRGRRGLAVGGTPRALRLLAVLAQHRGCRCGPVPQAVHGLAGGGMRPAGRPAGGCDQRGQENPGHRSHRDLPRPRCSRAGGRRGRATVRGGVCDRHRPRCAAVPADRAGAPGSRRASASPVRGDWAWCRATAKRGGWCEAAACGSTMQRSPTRTASSPRPTCTMAR